MTLWLDDVTSQTRQRVDTAVCRWKTRPLPEGPEFDCLCAVDATGHLILFERSGVDPWQSRNLSHILERRVSRVQPVHGNIRRAAYNPRCSSADRAVLTDVLILPDERGQLVLCHRQSQGSWALTDISVDCGLTIDCRCRPLIWDEHGASGDSLHVLAVITDGRLFEFFQHSGQAWQCRDTGARCASRSLSLSATRTPVDDTSRDARIMAFSVSEDGLLCRHKRRCGEWGVWKHESVNTGDSARLRSHSTATYTIGGLCHVAACDVFGSVLIYQQNSDYPRLQGWFKTDVSAQTGCRARAIGSALVLLDQPRAEESSIANVVLTAHGNGRAYRFWWNEQEQWQVTDLDETVGLGTRLSAHPGSANSRVESLAMVSDDRLVLVEGLDGLRSMSRRILGGIPKQGCPEFSRHRSLLSRVMAWQHGSDPVPELRAIGEAVFGSRTVQRNASSYLDYVSSGAFTLQRDDVVGWLTEADLPLMEPQTSAQGSAEDLLPASERVRQRIQQAIHGASSAGSVGIGSTESTVQEPMDSSSTDRLLIAACHGPCPVLADSSQRVLWPVTDSISVIRLLQEILATCARLPRLPSDASGYDLMSLDPVARDDSRFLHPNGAWKLLLGWVRPRVAVRAMRYRLAAVSDSREVIVLAREITGPVEYFVIENRQRRPMDDVSAPGLLIWHVSQLCGESIDQVDARGDGSAWEVTLASAVVEGATSIDRLVWADGRASGYTLRNVSTSADVMSFDLDVSNGC